MMYILDLSIKEKGSSDINPDIDAEEVSSRKKYFDNNYYDIFMEEELFFDKLKLYKRLPDDPEPTILNDIHSWSGQYPYMCWSYPVSERYKNLLEQYKLIGSTFYPGNLNFQGKSYPYYVFHTLDSVWSKVINFEESNFAEWLEAREKIFSEDVIKISSLEEYDIERKKMVKYSKEKYGKRHTIGPKEIHFSEEVDLVYLPILRYCISERLKNAIEAANITGVEIIPITNVDFYYQGEKL